MLENVDLMQTLLKTITALAPALTALIPVLSKINRRGLIRFVVITVVALMLSALVLVFRLPNSAQRYDQITGVLKRYNPQVFGTSEGEHLEIARVVANSVGFDGFNVKQMFEATQHSLDLLIFTGQRFFPSQEDDLLELLRKPVTVRILLMDPSTNNFEQAGLAMGYELRERKEQAKESRRIIERIRKRVADDNRKNYHGSIDVRWFDAPIFYSLILSDPGRESQFIRLGVYTGLEQRRPYFVADQNGKFLAQKVTEDFERRWQLAKKN